MTGIELWSTTAASNNSAVPNGFPEGMLPSGVNDAARQVMAAVREWFETAEWINLGYTPTYISATSFSVTGDKTTTFQVGRRVKMYGTTPFTLYGTIATSVFGAVTTVTVTMDSGSLNATMTTVWVSINSVTNKSVSSSMLSGTTGSGSVVLATSPTLVTPVLGTPTSGNLTNCTNMTYFAIGSTTYDLSTATGTVAITGLGFTPKSVTILANVDGTSKSSNGFSNVTTNRCQYQNNDSTFSQRANVMCILTDGSNFVSANISSFDADGFTLSYTKTGLPTGTANVSYMAQR